MAKKENRFSKLLDTTLAKGKSKFKELISKAKSWFQSMSKKKIKIEDITKDKSRQREMLRHGNMYHFLYQAKWDQKLPYWDKFPLVFPVEMYRDGFLGINFHYLHPRLRAVLLDALSDNVNNKKYNDTTKMKISYSVLKGVSKYKYFKPCLKRYLWSYVRSKFILIHPDEWHKAIFLPTAQFQKASQEEVWKQSKGMV